MNHPLIEVHLANESSIICDCCDGWPEDTKLYYRIHNPKDIFERCRKYLPCCLSKVGYVVDWEENSAK